VTGNNVSAVGVDQDFAEDANCSPATGAAFAANQHLLWNQPSVSGATNLQSGFIEHTDFPSFFICPTPPLPNQQTWAAGALSVTTEPTTFSQLHNFKFIFDTSAHLIVQESGVVITNVGATTTCNNECGLFFQSDGNLVKRLNTTAFWASNTANRGSTLTVMNTSPWLKIENSAGAVIWDAVNGVGQSVSLGVEHMTRANQHKRRRDIKGLLKFTKLATIRDIDQEDQHHRGLESINRSWGCGWSNWKRTD
jgi:hypothetical protein